MNLESFGISNFKAFGADIQRMPLKPITLLFGSNSAGKSSALHSLLWLHHAVLQGKIDFRFPEAGGGRIDLGGFSQILHRSDEHGKSIAVELAIAKDALPQNVLESFAIEKNVTLELTFGASPGGGQASPALTHYRIKIDTRDFLAASRNRDGGLKVEHLDRELLPKQEPKTAPVEESPQAVLSRLGIGELGDSPEEKAMYVEMLELEIKKLEGFLRDAYGDLIGTGWLPTGISSRSLSSGPVGSLISAVAKAVTDYFAGLCYVPPLRDLPARYFDLSGADATWQRLFDQPKLLGKINQWLDSEQFRTRYELIISEYFSRSSLEKKLPALLRNVNGNRALDLYPEALELDDVYSFVEKLEIVVDSLLEKFRGIDANELIKSYPELQEIAAEMAYDSFLKISEDDFREFYGQFTHKSFEEMGEGERKEFSVKHWDQVDFSTTFGYGGYKEFGNSDSYGILSFRTWAMDQPELIKLIESHFDPGECTKRFLDQQTKSGGNVRREILLKDKKHQTEVSLQDVGVGISQVLPVILHAFGEKGKLIAIEQPEIHIHPALQAELGDAFIESALGENKNTFLLETHSEHLILRLLRRIRETTRGKLPEGKTPLTPADIAVLYVEPGEKGSVLRELRVNDQGRFIDEWPNGFFEGRLEELI